MRYIIDHTNLHFGIPELVILLFMLVVIFIAWRKTKKLKEKNQTLADKLAEITSAGTLEEAEEVLEKISVDLGEEQNQ